MKMSKKIISLLLVLVLSLSMSVTALAQTSSQEDIIESLGMQNVSSSAIGFATDYNSLSSLINGKVENIIVLNNIQMLDTLTIDYDVLFATPASGVALFAAEGKKHFKTSGDVTIEVDMSYGGRVYLDGNYIGGGIYNDYSQSLQSLTLINLSVVRCNGSGIETESGSITLAGTTDISYNAGSGIGGYFDSLTITDETSISDNQYDGVNSYSGYVDMINGKIYRNGGQGISTFLGSVRMAGGEISNNSGAGIYSSNAGVSMQGGVISWNGGGGINIAPLKGTSFSMSGGVISNNTADYGGGINYYFSIYITGGLITNNYARYYGGGIACESEVSLSNCYITGNSAGISGGGVAANDVYVGNNVYFYGNYPDNIYIFQ